MLRTLVDNLSGVKRIGFFATMALSLSSATLLAQTAPTISTTGGASAFVEADGGASVPVAIDPGLTVVDPDSPTLALTLVLVAAGFEPAEDVLVFVNDGSTMGNIAATYDSGTGILLLSSDGVTATLAQWQAALRAVQYTNTSEAPNTTTRTFSFQANDGALVSSNALKSVSVASVNDTPTDLALSNATLAQSAGASAVVGTLSTTDADPTATHTYALVSGVGDQDNTAFAIVGNSLRAVDASTLAGGSYSVRIQTTDDGGATFAKSFTVTVTDDVAPGVTAVSSPAANGTYKAGDVLAIQVAFSEPVTVTGTPQLTLETGSTDRVAAYIGGSGTSVLEFSYTVQASDLSSDLDYVSTEALALDGGTIRDSASLAASLALPAPGAANSLGANKALVIDGATQAPVLVAPSANVFENATVAVNFTLPESALAGSVTLTFARTGGAADAGSPHVLTLAAGFETSGSHAGVLDASNLAAAAFVASTTGGASLVDGAVYSVTLGYRDGAGNAAATTTQVNFTCDLSAPAITSALALGGTYGAELTYTITAGGDPVAYGASGLPSGLSVNGSTGEISGSPSSTGVFDVELSATDAAGNTGTATLALTIGKAAQTITFAEVGEKATTAGTFALEATASSGLAVSFERVSGPASVTGATVTLTGAPGMVTVVARQEGDARYAAAAEVTRSFAVVAPAPLIGFGALNDGVQPQGEFAVYLAADGASGALIGQVHNTGAFVVEFVPEVDGSFTASAPLVKAPAAATPTSWTFNGQIVGSVITGTVTGSSVVFAGAFDPSSGAAAPVAGYYPCVSLETSEGAVHVMIGSSGEVYALALLAGLVEGGSGMIDPATGAFTGQGSAAAAFAGEAEAARGTLAGTVTPAGAESGIGFGGLRLGIGRNDRLVNLSSRAHVSTGDAVVIAGFYVGGAGDKQVLVRAIGPTLSGFQVNQPLADPRVTLLRDDTVIASNDNWGEATNATDIAAAMTRTGAFGLEAASKDSGILMTLAPGRYTAIVEGTGGGIALAEVYDASENPHGESHRLLNISTRALVGAGDSALIGGFYVAGNAPKRVLVRGIGPRLADFNVTGALPDPRLTIFTGSKAIAENEDWGSGANAADELVAAASATGAFSLVAGSKDAALLITLAPGAYTAHVTSASGTGIALVEVYELP